MNRSPSVLQVLACRCCAAARGMDGQMRALSMLLTADLHDAGSVNIPGVAPGNFTFTMDSDDGSLLSIDGKVIVSNPGARAAKLARMSSTQDIALLRCSGIDELSCHVCRLSSAQKPCYISTGTMHATQCGCLATAQAHTARPVSTQPVPCTRVARQGLTLRIFCEAGCAM